MNIDNEHLYDLMERIESEDFETAQEIINENKELLHMIIYTNHKYQSIGKVLIFDALDLRNIETVDFLLKNGVALSVADALKFIMVEDEDIDNHDIAHLFHLNMIKYLVENCEKIVVNDALIYAKNMNDLPSYNYLLLKKAQLESPNSMNVVSREKKSRTRSRSRSNSSEISDIEKRLKSVNVFGKLKKRKRSRNF